MSKKKSYMDRKNILSENWIMDTLASVFLIPSNFEKYKERKLDKFAKQVEESDKKIAKLEKEAKDAQEAFFKQLEKDSGVKIKREPARKAIEKKLKQKHKR